MHVVAIGPLRQCWNRHPDAEAPLRAWYEVASRADWMSPQDVVNALPKVDFVGHRAVFNIGGNKCRLVVLFAFRKRWAFVKFVGMHAEYDKIDVATVELK